MNFLNKEYTKYHPANKQWKNGLFLATVILLIFLLFQPFGFRDKELELKLMLFPIYSLLAYFYSSANFIIIRYILKSKKKWFIKDELLSFVIGILPFAFLIHLITFWLVDDMPLSFHWYFKLLYHVSSLFIVATIIEFLYYNNRSSSVKQQKAF